jgi:hypothetical protein
MLLSLPRQEDDSKVLGFSARCITRSEVGVREMQEAELVDEDALEKAKDEKLDNNINRFLAQSDRENS